jgi:hypothetical protein
MRWECIEKSPTLLGFLVRWPTSLVVLPGFCAGCSRVLAYLYGKTLAGHTVWLMQRWASGSVGWALHSRLPHGTAMVENLYG